MTAVGWVYPRKTRAFGAQKKNAKRVRNSTNPPFVVVDESSLFQTIGPSCEAAALAWVGEIEAQRTPPKNLRAGREATRQREVPQIGDGDLVFVVRVLDRELFWSDHTRFKLKLQMFLTRRLFAVIGHASGCLVLFCFLFEIATRCGKICDCIFVCLPFYALIVVFGLFLSGGIFNRWETGTVD